MRYTLSRSLALLLAFAIGPKAAHADRLLFESYVGDRPADAARVIPLIRSVFERHGFTVDPLVLAMYFRDHAYRPGLVAPRFAETLKRAALRAEDDFSEEKYPKMVADLGNQILAMRQNPQIFTREPKHREFALRVLVFYALACGRQARALADKPDEAARLERLRDDTMAEVIRSFPSKIITSKDFGDEGEALFLRIRNQVNQLGRGRIAVTSSDPDAVIYINEIVHGTAKVNAGDFVPGIYRVLIQMPTGEARQYELEVTANQTSRLVVDWGIDSLITLDGWVGFRYLTEKEHAREATLVQLLAQAHTNASMAATVTLRHTRGHLEVIGTSYDARSGKLLHSGSVELAGNPSNDTMLNRLVDCLMGELCAEGVLPAGHPEYMPPPVPEIPETAPTATPAPVLAALPATSNRAPVVAPSDPAWPKWLAAGSSAAMLAMGGYVLYEGNTVCGWGEPACKISPAYPIVGYTALGVGLAICALSWYGFHENDLSPDWLPAKWPLIGGAAAIAIGTALYAIDEDPAHMDSRGRITKYYWDTAPIGVALGVAGLASVGVGVWRWQRNTPASSTPTLSVSSSRTVVGWLGQF